VPVVCVAARVVRGGLGCLAARAGPHVPVAAEPWMLRMVRIAVVPGLDWCVFAVRQLSAAGARRGSSAGLCWSACCADGVRGCPCDPAAGSPRARTYSGRRRCGTLCSTVFAQVRCHMEVEAGAYCKTVGSAYVGSNPTPATTCENGPLAAETRPAGRFVLVTMCITMCHRGSIHSSGCGHIADSVRAERAVRITARFADPRRFCPSVGHLWDSRTRPPVLT
jgi:hypothetical protein